VKGRVLVVDDEVELLEAYAEILTDAGHTVSTARDGRMAAALVAKESFEAILSDITMPGMDGLQLLRAVRERDLDVPVLIMTGNPNVESAVQALEHGALRYLLKPLKAAALVHAVDEAVRLCRMAQLKREALSHLGGGEMLLGDRAGLEAAFSRALTSLWMAYQPIVHASDARVFGHEALVRTAERTLPHPGALLDAAERLGRMPVLGRAVRDSVASFLARSGKRTSVFINLHTLDLADDALYLPASPLSQHAANVVLEVTERASLDQIPDVRGRVKMLKEMGFRIALDDLGAGYAGLTSFAILEPDVVKLDMSLIRGVDQEPIKRRLVGSMIELCKELGILVVAEGVETVAERTVLTDLGCDLLQGYLFGRPGQPPEP
jgi:EAL domain-containing protein (putative c-di-GMP-specific phosphodiesterase class I)